MARLNSSRAGNSVRLFLYFSSDVSFTASSFAGLFSLDHSSQSDAALCCYRARFFLQYQPAQHFADLLSAGFAFARPELLATQKRVVIFGLPAALLASKKHNSRLLPYPVLSC